MIIDFDAATTAWTLLGPQSRYRINLSDATLVCDCFASGDDPLPAPHGAAMPMVALGRHKHPVMWRLDGWQQETAGTLAIALRSDHSPLQAAVRLIIDADTGLLAWSTTLQHGGTEDCCEITHALSCWLDVHEPIEQVLYLSGAWAHEAQVQQVQPHRPLTLESRAGKTGFRFQPYAALSTKGAVYLCKLLWSGNWQLRIDPLRAGATLTAGLHDWHLRHGLHPGRNLTLPTVLFGRIAGDLNHATQHLHDYRRSHRPDPDRRILVQFNSWYPKLDALNEADMLALIPRAASLGCEAFVLDAGWFATDQGDPTTGWESRTGDWTVSRARFPHGLSSLSDRCREAGLCFGLWFEPEVIGQLSALRSTHPEWLHHIDGQPPEPEARAILHLGIPGARAHAFDRITRMLHQARVGWMKWDFNADFGPGGWAPGLPAELTAQDPLVAHYRGLYLLQDEVRAAFPDLILEMCASGGGRMDGALLSHAHVNWISDQPGPLRKLAIHFGCQLAHPAVACNDWLVEWPPGHIPGYDDDEAANEERGDLAFRLRVAMLGSFGISAEIDRWTATDIAIAQAHVALYIRQVRDIVHHGDQYQLTEAPTSHGDGDWAAIWYVAKDGARGVLFAFRLAGKMATRAFALPGLSATRRYRVQFFPAAPIELDGAALASGLSMTIDATFASCLCLVEDLTPP